MQGEANHPRAMLAPFHLQRGCAAAIACMAWSSLGMQFYFNIEEARIENVSVSHRLIDFFSYFTIETNLLIALVLTVYCLSPQEERVLTSLSVQTALAVYIIIVGVVYELMLRNLWHPHGLRLLADMVLHDAIPFFYFLYWLVFLPKGSLRWFDPTQPCGSSTRFFFSSIACFAASPLESILIPSLTPPSLALRASSGTLQFFSRCFMGLVPA